MIGFFHVVSLSGEVNVSETKVAQTGVRSIPRATLSQHLRSAVFSAVFSPVALIIMGFAVADTQAATAQGQPLSSSEGTVGIVITCGWHSWLPTVMSPQPALPSPLSVR